ncbi:MAG: hypothetical protein KGJ09_04855 [Candidatus Omnitrophica bacterium]|nr:hypothetical protein [Candidatus Omnitrophota bacterium]MDE2009392.1 hypothetical protein [Candidatus Omnitrophota bacterium]MDE2214176.1 hypothetical protein [Candidatus Omnitrophota bacterium]MDE2231213.1 hypothetical protein [Candidatus Omnitrophota bacterium]
MITNERWSKLSLFEQMGHIGSEVSRARLWQERNDTTSCNRCIERAFELVDLTIADHRWRERLKEICRFREVLADQYAAGHVYQVSLNELERYCMDFALAAKKPKGD